MKKFYAVLCITKSASVNNEIVKLDDGNVPQLNAVGDLKTELST